MDLLAPIVRSAIAPLWAAWERSPYLRHYRRLRQTEFDSAATIRERQWRQLTELIKHTYESTEFGRKRFDDAGIRPADIQQPADLLKIPVLTKHDLRDRLEEMFAQGFVREQLWLKKTSGSTGTSVKVYADEPAMQFKRACTLRSDEWTGWRLGDRKAMVWGNPEYLKRGWRGYLRNRLLEREIYLDTLKMTETDMRAFLQQLRKTPPVLIFGHAHSLHLFAQFVESQGTAGFQPRGVLSSAMVLHQWEREKIEQVFGCPVTNRYGCEEVSLIACECEEHHGLHINADGMYVEIINELGRPAQPGEAGNVVVTDLVNKAMPILRYQVGDIAVASDRECPCGRGLPMLERLEGRSADYVMTPSGELVSGISLTENFAMLVQGIAQLQIVQERLDHIRFRVVRGVDFNHESERQIAALVAERFGPQVGFECEFLDEIPRERSGKYRFCISKVENPFQVRSERSAS